jgi:hypothetical protein
MDMVSNTIALNRELVDEFKGYQKGIRGDTVSMAQKAFGIRSQYLSADGRKYDAVFESWWSTHDLDAVFGSRANFTKWASSGEALEKARIDEHSDQMPTTLTALYEVSQLTPGELKLCLQDRYTRTSLTDEPKGSKKPKPLIHPEVTAAEIKKWRVRWRSPKAKSYEKRRLAFATLQVHGSLYDEKSKHGSVVLTPEKLKEISDALTRSMTPYDDYVLLETKLEPLLEGHRRRQEQAEARVSDTAAKKRSRRKSGKGHSRLGSS